MNPILAMTSSKKPTWLSVASRMAKEILLATDSVNLYLFLDVGQVVKLGRV